MLGVVVVGLGRAGRARVQALEQHARASLRATVSREQADDLEVVLRDPRVDAVIVCTPNLLHEPGVRLALEAGKHVAVEFPLAPGREAARELFELARNLGRVLHVEHIELLSESQRRIRASARGLGAPVEGELLFEADARGWIARDDLAGTPGLRAVARLHRLLDIFGPARVADAHLERRRVGYRLEATLEFDRGGRLRLVEERAPGRPRRTTWRVTCQRGPLEPPAGAAAAGLFAADLDVFVGRIEGSAEPYVSEERILEVLGLVDAIDAASYSPARD